MLQLAAHSLYTNIQHLHDETYYDYTDIWNFTHQKSDKEYNTHTLVSYKLYNIQTNTLHTSKHIEKSYLYTSNRTPNAHTIPQSLHTWAPRRLTD